MKNLKNISIIGVGLIGGSLGMALRRKAAGGVKITGVGRHEEKLKLAKKLGTVDLYTTGIAEGVRNADIVVIASPVDTIPALVKSILPFVKAGCVITDVGSVKESIIRDVEKVFAAAGKHKPVDASFVGAHPMAGSEKNGVVFASSDIFKNATVALVPTKTLNTQKSISAIKDMWKITGAKVVIMTAKEHDECVSATSHLPHLLSASLVEFVWRSNKANCKTAQLLAGSFRDMTRISNSDPKLWSVICSKNKNNLDKAISVYIAMLKILQKNLGSAGKLNKFFKRSKNNRWNLLKSSQKKESR